MALTILFMGTPDFAIPAFNALLESEHTITAAYTQPPRPAGRGKKTVPSPVHTLAQSHDIPVHHPLSLKEAEAHDIFLSHTVDIAVVVAYGLLLPDYVLNHPKLGCVNIHPSTLPRWRGAAPIQRTLMAGDNETSIAIMQMDSGLDTGDILTQTHHSIDPNCNAGELHDELADKGALQLIETLSLIEQGNITPVKQSDNGVTYAHKIDKAEAAINWHQSAQKIHNHIRGLSPYPGAYFTLGNDRIKILQADYIELDHSYEVGTIFDDLRIACQDGFIIPLTVQKTGKKPMSTHDFLNGHTIQPGTLL